MTQRPSADLIFAVVAIIGALLFFSIYRAWPEWFPDISDLPPPP